MVVVLAVVCSRARVFFSALGRKSDARKLNFFFKNVFSSLETKKKKEKKKRSSSSLFGCFFFVSVRDTKHTRARAKYARARVKRIQC